MTGLSYEDLLTIHEVQMDLFGGLRGLTQQGLDKIKYAASAPFLTMGNEELYPTIESKAAILMKTIVCGHPFLDGNKRTGLEACLLLLQLNGVEYSFDEDEAIALTLNLAAGKIDQEEITDWVEKIMIR